MTSWITICDTCKLPDWAERGVEQTDGNKFAGLIEAAAAGRDVQTRRVNCTMGCERACNVVVQAAGKIGYSLGKFEPTAEAAQALVDYAEMHRQSETGQVPFKQWPQGIKGHFVSRQIPLPEAS